ncbi:MAG: hypothetical protein ACFFD4_12360 [Candidatus Odinarchaeota archaeon]
MYDIKLVINSVNFQLTGVVFSQVISRKLARLLNRTANRRREVELEQKTSPKNVLKLL